VLLARFGCCLATRRASVLLSKHGVADLASKQTRNAQAGNGTRVTSTGGLYDTATLHVLLLHFRWYNKNR
jgi:hypothetical protein